MTKRDYEALAAAFAEAYADVQGTDPLLTKQRVNGVTTALKRVSTVLLAENPRFDPVRFKRAAQKEATS
jgi:hypothetical protein